MRARIHRGAAQIGGTCIELEASGKRLLLDLGRPLDAGWDEEVEMPAADGLAHPDPSLLGVVVSHAHPDHFGLVAELEEPVPFFIGEAAERVLGEAHLFGAAPDLPRATGHLRDRKAIELGPFRITPYLADHSAFDAYALLVEADGRRLFYSGDLRGHGRKAALFERLLGSPPERIDALLLEGTSLGRSRSGGCDPEDAVEEAASDFVGESPSFVLACYSPQNVDRHVSLFKAARRSKRSLVLDLYAQAIARATGRRTIPNANWEGVTLHAPPSQWRRMREHGRPDSELALWNTFNVPYWQLLAQPESHVFLFRQSMIRVLESFGVPPGTRLIWSMWPGYLDRPESQPLLDFCARHEITIEIIHASGHATVADLRRFAQALEPQRVVPIHTAHPERYTELYERVQPHADGEWWEI